MLTGSSFISEYKYKHGYVFFHAFQHIAEAALQLAELLT
jgi:hypothetical protein